MAVPAIDSIDPFRGSVTFVSITDNTQTDPVYSRRGQDGRFDSQPRSQTELGITESRLRFGGWVLLASLISGLILARMRSKNGG